MGPGGGAAGPRGAAARVLLAARAFVRPSAGLSARYPRPGAALGPRLGRILAVRGTSGLQGAVGIWSKRARGL